MYMPSKQDCSVFSLPEAVLEYIFHYCDQYIRVCVLPRVCRAFRALLNRPSACLWSEVSLDLNLPTPGQPERAANFLTWLARHGALSKTLLLDTWNGPIGAPALLPPELALEQRLGDSLAASLASCEYLRLRWGGPELVVGDWISNATSLTCMALSAHTLRLTSHLAALTSLSHLEVTTYSDNGPQLEPRCLPPSITRLCCVPAPAREPADEMGHFPSEVPEQVLALPRLLYLDVSESWFTRQHLSNSFPRLTQLTSLALDKCELPGGLPPELGLLTRLRVLSFDGCIHLDGQQGPDAWAALGSLTGLMSLSLSNCNLHDLPPSVVLLTHMQHLYLEFNSIRYLPPGPYMRHLQVLSTDWEPLLRSHYLLLPRAPHLHKLALGSMSVIVHAAEGLPPVSSVDVLLEALRGHQELREILLIVRPTFMHGTSVHVLEAILHLATLRPNLAVRPLQHDLFFVEDAPSPPEGEDGGGAEAEGVLAAGAAVPAGGQPGEPVIQAAGGQHEGAAGQE